MHADQQAESAHAAPTVRPPAMPRMSARDDGPRVIEYAGPESRYHRLRREAAARAANVTLVDVGVNGGAR